MIGHELILLEMLELARSYGTFYEMQPSIRAYSTVCASHGSNNSWDFGIEFKTFEYFVWLLGVDTAVPFYLNGTPDSFINSASRFTTV